MSVENLDQVKSLALDLQTQEPRPKSETLAGFRGGKRALDKCRATLAGTPGDFIFNCPADQRFFAAAGIDAEEFKREVATGADDAHMEEWVKARAKPASQE